MKTRPLGGISQGITVYQEGNQTREMEQTEGWARA